MSSKAKGKKRALTSDSDEDYTDELLVEQSSHGPSAKPATLTRSNTRPSRSSRISRQKSDISNDDSTAKRTLSKTSQPRQGEYWNRNLSQLEKIEKALRDYNINARSMGRADEYLAQTLDSLFDVPLPTGVADDKLFKAQTFKTGARAGVPKFQSKGEKKNKSTWALVLEGPNKSKVNLNFVENDLVDIDDNAVRRQLGALLERFYNAFDAHHPIPDNTGLQTEVVDMAIARVNFLTQSIAAPAWIAAKGLYIAIPFVNEVTGEKEYFDYTSAVCYTLTPHLPPLPLNATLYIRGQRRATTDLIQTAPGVWQSVIPDEILDGTAAKLPKYMSEESDPRKLLETEKLMRFCSWKMSNLRSTQDKMRVIRNHYVAMFTITSESQTRKSRMTGLFNIRRSEEKGVTVMSAGASMIHNLGVIPDDDRVQLKNKLNCRILSLDAHWVAVAIEYGSKVYEDTGSMFETLVETAQIVDLINSQIQNGLSPPNTSTCTPDVPADRKPCTHHKCAICFQDVECEKRERTADGLWVDKQCAAKEEARGSQASKRTRSGLARSHKAEARNVGQDPDDEDNKLIYERCVAEVEKKHKEANPPEGRYRDGYSGLTFPLFRGLHPFNNCVDCVLPANLDHRGQLRGHVERNLLEAPISLNLAKGSRVRNLPADIHSIATYQRRVDDSESSDVDDRSHRRQAVLQACDEHNQVQCKYRMNAAAALGSRSTAPEYADLRAEFVAGKLSGAGADKQANAQAKQHAERILPASDIVSCGWDEMQVARIKQFGTEASVTQWADDGAPWPFPDVPMPLAFKLQGLDLLYSLLRLRLGRMRLVCNRYWVTVDTEVSLAAEMFFQNYLEPDGEFLGLPLSPYLWHALLMSVAHRHHGQQMRTGYGPQPTSLFSRDAALSNILLETVFSNTFKWDFDEKYYPEMKQYLSKVVVPKEFHDPTVSGGATFEGIPAGDELDYNLGIITRAVEEDSVAEHNRLDGDVNFEPDD